MVHWMAADGTGDFRVHAEDWDQFRISWPHWPDTGIFVPAFVIWSNDRFGFHCWASGFETGQVDLKAIQKLQFCAESSGPCDVGGEVV